MSITIALTPAMRTLPYFSTFKEDEVTVPAQAFLQELLDDSLSFEALSISELIQCIRTCRYFGLDSTEAVWEFIWKAGETAKKFNWLFEKAENINMWRFSPRIPPSFKAELTRILNASSFNTSNLIQLGVRHIRTFTKLTCKRIAKEGNVRLLKWAHEQGMSWDESTCTVAAFNGHLDCLRYAHEQGCPWDEQACFYAAGDGHLSCLQYLHEQGCPWNKYAGYNAVKKGHLECLQYLCTHGCPLDIGTCAHAAHNGRLDCLKYLHEQGCPWNKDVCQIAAVTGRLYCLQYAHEQGCPWDEKTSMFAAQGGQLECLKYLYEHGCPMSPEIILECTKEQLACAEYLKKNGYQTAQRTVKFFHGIGCMIKQELNIRLIRDN